MIPSSSGGATGNEEGRTTSRSNSGALDGGGKGNTASLKKGPWTAAEDAILMEYVKKHGEGNWNAVQRNSGLSRCGKSCRLRWANHLRPNLKKGSFSPEEERLILELHAKLGNKWARMAAQLPGRTDNEIKNYWNTRVKRRLRQGLPLYPQGIPTQPTAFHLQHSTQTSLSPSPTPPPPSHLSSPHQSTPTYNSNPSLSLLDPVSLSSQNTFFSPHTPPLISSQFNRYKRYHNSSIGFSFPISRTQQPSSPLVRHSMPAPLPHISSFQLGPVNFDQNSPQIIGTQFEREDGLVQSPGVLNFSASPELPSSQLSQTTAQRNNIDDTKITLNLARSNSGLLDDLLREAQTMSCGGDLRRLGLLGSENENDVFNGFGGNWDDSSSVHSPSRKKLKGEPLDENNYMHEDLSNILGLFPSAMQVPLWYSDGGENSNGQSSGVTEDHIGLAMQQLTSSLPVAAAAAAAANWDNIPGICSEMVSKAY